MKEMYKGKYFGTFSGLDGYFVKHMTGDFTCGEIYENIDEANKEAEDWDRSEYDAQILIAMGR